MASGRKPVKRRLRWPWRRPPRGAGAHRTRRRSPADHRAPSAPAILRAVSANRAPEPAEAASALAVALVDWYRANRPRPRLPAHEPTPYAILVSEAMAQQTQAHAQRPTGSASWRASRPSRRSPPRRPPTSCASGRASATTAARSPSGGPRGSSSTSTAASVPDTVDRLEACPGVGPYTARAVAAIAFGRPVGAVDVNVRRVLGRVVGGDSADVPRAEHPGRRRRSRPRRPARRPGPTRSWTSGRPYAGRGSRAATLVPARTVVPVRRLRRRPRGLPPARATSSATRDAPFPATNRWLRGRILDRLRAAPDGDWVALDATDRRRTTWSASTRRLEALAARWGARARAAPERRRSTPRLAGA